jgi:mitochondrial fission protein ELM1
MNKREARNAANCGPATPHVLILPVRDGVQPNNKPPVRIFVGSEPAQYRAERVFFYSIEKYRDPARVYEIALMKSLRGFDDRRWLTNFTNYRFAVPHFAGEQGKAIYNDTDQVYCDDPAKLFDLELGDYSFLAITERDTSVMLMDCAKMIDVWTFERAKRWRKNRLIDLALAETGAYGVLGGEWNARDQDHREGWSKCVHFTTIHKQPWRPFPKRFVYQPNPVAQLFEALEAEARAVGFNVFTRDRPSAKILAEETSKQEHPIDGDLQHPEILNSTLTLIDRANAQSLLEVTTGNFPLHLVAEPISRGLLQKKVALGKLLEEETSDDKVDGIVCLAALETLPIDDLPWIIDEIVARAKKFVLIAVQERPRRSEGRRDHGTIHQVEWWTSMLESACARHRKLHWSLIVAQVSDYGAHSTIHRQGGKFLGNAAPTVWLLEDHKPGHTTQSLGLIEALGWPYRRIKLDFGPLAARPNFLRGPTLRGLTSECAATFTEPWPDLVVATGARAAPVAEWIRNASKGRTRTVQLGRKGAHLGNEFDLSVAPSYVGLYPDPRRMETTVPLTRVRQSELDAAADRWRPILAAGPTPRIALLVGGDDSVYALDAAQASRMGGEVATLARDAGGSVFVTTSRRTETKAARALVAALGNVTVHSYHWSAAHHDHENPYLGYLALADILVVSGESASMLAEASATGKPVFIYPLEKRGNDAHRVKFLMGQSVSQWVMRRAFAQPLNRRGRERPQVGLELLCARLAARGWIRPHGDITRMHDALIERGSAQYFNGALPETLPEPFDEAKLVAARVRALLGVDLAET